MTAYLILLLAALSRLVPHSLHGIGLNITAVGGGLLYFGARRSRWEALCGALVMALTDIYLTAVVFGMSFHVQSYLVTWFWYAAVCLLGSSLLRRVTAVRVGVAVVASATGFFLLSNAVVWVGGGLYNHSLGGLLACYTAALPFYGNDLVSTGLTAGVLFGLPALARQLVHGLRTVGSREPLA